VFVSRRVRAWGRRRRTKIEREKKGNLLDFAIAMTKAYPDNYFPFEIKIFTNHRP